MRTEDKPLFSFANKKGKSRVKEPFVNFLNLWGMLPIGLAFAIHDKAMEANSAWGMSWLPTEDEEEEILTDSEGNEEADE